jgi:hypothetical protein
LNKPSQSSKKSPLRLSKETVKQLRASTGLKTGAGPLPGATSFSRLGLNCPVMTGAGCTTVE